MRHSTILISTVEKWDDYIETIFKTQLLNVYYMGRSIPVHHVCLSHMDISRHTSACDAEYIRTEEHRDEVSQYIYNRNYAIGLFCQRQKDLGWNIDATNYIFMDSDVVPFNPQVIMSMLSRVGKPLGRYNIEMVAPLQYEYINQFPGTCCMMTRGRYLDKACVSTIRDDHNPIYKSRVMGLPFYQGENAFKVYALLRSNMVNIHPVYHGIYGNAFYHAGVEKAYPNTMPAQKYYWKQHDVAPDYKKAIADMDSRDLIELINNLKWLGDREA